MAYNEAYTKTRTLENGQWTMDGRRWTFDGGLCTIPLSRNKSLRDVTSCIHASRDLSCCCLFSIFTIVSRFQLGFLVTKSRRKTKEEHFRSRNQLLHFLFFPVTFSSRNLDFDLLRSLFIYLPDMYQIQEIEPFQRYHLGLARQRKTILAVYFKLLLRH